MSEKPILLFLFLAVTSFAFGQHSGYANIITVKDGWQYRWGDSPIDEDGRFEWLSSPADSGEWKIYQPGTTPGGRGKSTCIWVRLAVPATGLDRPFIYLSSMRTNFEIYSRNELVYSYGEIRNGRAFRERWSVHFLPVKKYEGGYLYFRICNRFHLLPIGIGAEVLAGEEEALIKRLVVSEAFNVVFGSIIFLAGAFFIVLFLLKAADREGLYFGLTCGLLSLYFIPLSNLALFLFSNPPAFSDTHYRFGPWFMVFLLLYFQSIFPKNRIFRILTILYAATLSLHSLIAIIEIDLRFLGILFVNPIFYMVFIVMLIGLVLEVRRSVEVKILLAGLGITTLIMLFYQLFKFGSFYYGVRPAAIITLASFLLVVLYRYRKRLEAYEKIEAKDDGGMEAFCEHYGLSARECEVLEHLLQGKNAKEIGTELFIEHITVRKHISNIFRKTHVNSRFMLFDLFYSDRTKERNALRA